MSSARECLRTYLPSYQLLSNAGWKRNRTGYQIAIGMLNAFKQTTTRHPTNRANPSSRLCALPPLFLTHRHSSPRYPYDRVMLATAHDRHLSVTGSTSCPPLPALFIPASPLDIVCFPKFIPPQRIAFSPPVGAVAPHAASPSSSIALKRDGGGQQTAAYERVEATEAAGGGRGGHSTSRRRQNSAYRNRRHQQYSTHFAAVS